MDIFFYICLFIFGTLFWSFWSVVIYRLKSNEWWILNWRSHCLKCNKFLTTLDLIPIFSWLLSKAKCSNCKEKISAVYPILELCTWLLFAAIWYFLIDYNLIFSLNWIEITKLLFWLTIWFISILYTFYDLLFLEIHEWMMLSGIIIIFSIISIQTLIPWFNIIEVLPSWINDINNISLWIWSIITSTIIIFILYMIMIKWFHEIVDILLVSTSVLILYLFKKFTGINLSDIAILNWITWVLAIYIFFFAQIIVSKWAWMGWWDLRIAIMIWLILGISLSFAWLMLTYFVWSIIWIWFIIYNRIKNKWKKLNTQIPFWPFLAIWFFLTIFFNDKISDLMNIYF